VGFRVDGVRSGDSAGAIDGGGHAVSLHSNADGPAHGTLDPEGRTAEVQDMLDVLRRRRTPRGLLGRVGADPTWTRHHAVRRAIVLHRHTPPAVARNLLRHLHWPELAEVARAPHVHPVVRRLAERRLEADVAGMTVGERIAFARRAGRASLAALWNERDGRVWLSLLGNAQLIELDAVRLASSPQAPREALAALARSPRWGSRRAVRIALAKNPRTPVAEALGALLGLPRRDLRRVAIDAAVPCLVRVAAERRERSGAPPERKGASRREARRA
jgi:hypothetical protein